MINRPRQTTNHSKYCYFHFVDHIFNKGNAHYNNIINITLEQVTLISWNRLFSSL